MNGRISQETPEEEWHKQLNLKPESDHVKSQNNTQVCMNVNEATSVHQDRVLGYGSSSMSCMEKACYLVVKALINTIILNLNL